MLNMKVGLLGRTSQMSLISGSLSTSLISGSLSTSLISGSLRTSLISRSFRTCLISMIFLCLLDPVFAGYDSHLDLANLLPQPDVPLENIIELQPSISELRKDAAAPSVARIPQVNVTMETGSLLNIKLHGYLKVSCKTLELNDLPDWMMFNKGSATLSGIAPGYTTGQEFIIPGECTLKFVNKIQQIRIRIYVDTTNHLLSHRESASKNAKDIKCQLNQPVTAAKILLEANLTKLTIQQQVGLLQNMATFLELEVERLRVSSRCDGVHFDSDSDSLITGLGDVNGNTESCSTHVKWAVGCGTVHVDQMEILMKLETTAADGRMREAVYLGVIGWQVVNDKSHVPVHLRQKRQVIVVPTATNYDSTVPTSLDTVATMTIEPTSTYEEPPPSSSVVEEEEECTLNACGNAVICPDGSTKPIDEYNGNSQCTGSDSSSNCGSSSNVCLKKNGKRGQKCLCRPPIRDGSCLALNPRRSRLLIFKLQFRIRSCGFFPSFTNKKSKQYIHVEIQVVNMCNRIYGGNPLYIGVTLNTIRSGSLIVDYSVHYQTVNETDDPVERQNVIDVLEAEIRNISTTSFTNVSGAAPSFAELFDDIDTESIIYQAPEVILLENSTAVIIDEALLGAATSLPSIIVSVVVSVFFIIFIAVLCCTCCYRNRLRAWRRGSLEYTSSSSNSNSYYTRYSPSVFNHHRHVNRAANNYVHYPYYSNGGWFNGLQNRAPSRPAFFGHVWHWGERPSTPSNHRGNSSRI